MAILAAEHVRRFGIDPKIALVVRTPISGPYDTDSAPARCAGRWIS